MAGHIPPAPALDIELQVHVFVHHSAPESEENHRLAMYGEKMLDAAYIAALAAANPNMDGNTLRVSAEGGLPGFASLWVENYGWAARMLAVPPGVDLNNPQESLRILQTYAGAVVQAHGDHALFDWIALLV